MGAGSRANRRTRNTKLGEGRQSSGPGGGRAEPGFVSGGESLNTAWGTVVQSRVRGTGERAAERESWR